MPLLKNESLPMLEMPEELGINKAKLSLNLPMLEMPKEDDNIVDLDKLPKLPMPEEISLSSSQSEATSNIKPYEMSALDKNVANKAKKTTTKLKDLFDSVRKTPVGQFVEGLVWSAPEDISAKTPKGIGAGLSYESGIGQTGHALSLLPIALAGALKFAPKGKMLAKDAELVAKKAIQIKDVWGEPGLIQQGEKIVPQIMSDNKVLLKGKDEFLVNKNQYQNLKNQSIQGGKEFAPELNQIEEVIKSGKGSEFDRELLADKIATLQKRGQEVFNTTKDINNPRYLKIKNEIALLQEEERMNKFNVSRYNSPDLVLPNGNNYREILLKSKVRENLPYNLLGEEGEILKTFSNREEAFKYYNKNLSKLQQEGKSISPIKGSSKDYISNHFPDDPNLIVHLRVNDRITPDGKKVLFLEELQSDWNKAGREKGFSNPQYVITYKTPEGLKTAEFNNRADAEKFLPTVNSSTAGIRKIDNGAIPNHPLLKNWQELGLKKALKEAVDNNYDYLSWINGKQTADRYNLAKSISWIDWTTSKSGLRIIEVMPKYAGSTWSFLVDKNGKIVSGVIDNSVVTGKNVEEVFGKDVAKQIMGNTEKTLNETDLKMGGEWANNLYDKQIPNILKDLTGETPEIINIGTPQQAIKITPEIKVLVSGNIKPISGAVAGLEPEYDEKGNIVGYKFNPVKAGIGIGAMGLAGRVSKKQPFNYELKGLKQTIKGSKAVVPDLVEKIGQEMYQVRNTKNLMIKAKNLVHSDPETAWKLINSPDLKLQDASTATGLEMIKKLSSEGKHDQAIDLIDKLDTLARERGRATQVISGFSKLTPNGILRFAQRTIDKLSKEVNIEPIKLSDSSKKDLYKDASELQKMIDGSREKEILTQVIMKKIQEQVPPGLAEKISTFQTMGQLLNVKTLVRNLIGNTGFQVLENINQALVATPIDWSITGIRNIARSIRKLPKVERTVGLPGITTQIKGYGRGLKEGIEDALMGIDTSPIGASKFDLPRRQVFKGILGGFEKALNIALRATDRASMTSAIDDSIRMQKKLANLPKDAPITSDMIQNATSLGLYRTFNDQNWVSNTFVGLKKELNRLGFGGKNHGKRFGIGDVVLKYPKTPGNLLARALDYSPAGFIKSVYEIGKPLFTKTEFNQQVFVNNLSRAITGSVGGLGIGYGLAKLGIITEAPSKDKDVRALQKESGQGGYQINVSALKRYILSLGNPSEAKLKPNDLLISYDWFQPHAIMWSMGARIANKELTNENTIQTFLGNVASGSETLVEQPVVSGVRNLVQGYKSPIETVIDSLKQAPASMFPTIINQVGQLMDNTARETYDPNVLKETLNKIKTRLPVIREQLPPRISTLGKPMEMYQNKGNTPFNVLVNPAFINRYQPNKTAQEIIRLMETTGEKTQFPQVVPRKITKGKTKIELSPKQIMKGQTWQGKLTNNMITNLIDNPEYQALPDEEKVKIINKGLSSISSTLKNSIISSFVVKQLKSLPKDRRNTFWQEALKEKLVNEKTYPQIINLIKQGKTKKNGNL